MSKTSNNSPSNAAGMVTKIGFLGAKFTAKILAKGVSAGVQATIDAVRGPQDFISVIDTKRNASDVLFQVLNWGASKKYISAHDFSKRMSIFALAQIIRNDLMPKVPQYTCILRLSDNKEVNDFWETVLRQQMISYVFQ
ncbi:MAG: hypothetical protein PHU93_01010 [Candidatus Gracilibacteria bacterium]|nr:hypothetical protein [Candidatus Gracilibacteria bacterium]